MRAVGRSQGTELTIFPHNPDMVRERSVVVHKELVPLGIGEEKVADLESDDGSSGQRWSRRSGVEEMGAEPGGGS